MCIRLRASPSEYGPNKSSALKGQHMLIQNRGHAGIPVPDQYTNLLQTAVSSVLDDPMNHAVADEMRMRLRRAIRVLDPACSRNVISVEINPQKKPRTADRSSEPTCAQSAQTAGRTSFSQPGRGTV